MEIELRPAAPADAPAASRIVYEAFKGIADRHAFPPAFVTPEVAERVVTLLLGLPAMWSRVAVSDGRPSGVIFLDEGDPIRGVAVVAVDPGAQRRGTGRRLMEAALERARGAPGVRLIQEAYNAQSMGLYASLGFTVREPLVRMTGLPRSGPPPGFGIREMTAGDLEACGRLQERVHGFTRTEDLRDALRYFAPFVCERGGRITACTYSVHAGILAWGVGETEEDLRALLLGVARAAGEPFAFHLPTRQAGLFRFCLEEGLRIEKPLTLMALGDYREPRGAFFPSGVY